MMPKNWKTMKTCVVAAMILLMFAVALTACARKAGQQASKPPVPVAVGLVIQKAVPVQLSIIGNVEPSSTVGVRAQVGGTLTGVHFKEGQDVNKGDLLFTIDPRPYEAALRQAEANLARSIAQFENAKAEERRYEELVKKGYVSQNQYEQVRTNAVALEATVFADKALVENARLNLSYCTIRAPFTGRTGSLVVYEGNLIKANADTPMVTINQIQPVNVSFSVPERNLPEIKKYMAGGALKVEAFASKEDKNPAVGRLSFIENVVDMATGTIRLKGSFDNRDKRLWPGQFVNVVLTLTVQDDAVVAPNQAIQTGQQGQFVFVIRDDLAAEVKSVVVSRTVGEEAVIERGLTPGERVVTDGQIRLTPGAKVDIKGQKAEGGVQAPKGAGGEKISNPGDRTK